MKYLRVADGLLDVSKKRILAAADLVVERQETTPPVRATVEGGGLTFCETTELYGPFANDGLQMEAGLNEAGPIGVLPAQI